MGLGQDAEVRHHRADSDHRPDGEVSAQGRLHPDRVGRVDLKDVPVSERNHLIDLARVLSVLIVVVFHTLLWTVGIGEDGVTVVPWAPGPAWWAISWVATIVPIFFVAAGYANAVVVDTWRATARPYSVFLTLRGSRLLGPLSVAMIMFTTVGGVGRLDNAGGTLSRQFAQLFWFAGVPAPAGRPAGGGCRTGGAAG